MVIEIRNKLVKTITSKHYFTLTPKFCDIGKVFSKIQSPPNTISHSFLYFVKLKMGSSKSNHHQTLHQKTSSQTKPRVLERKKDGLAFNIRRTVILVLVVYVQICIISQFFNFNDQYYAKDVQIPDSHTSL